MPAVIESEACENSHFRGSVPTGGHSQFGVSGITAIERRRD
jgi:hypothetical protein